MHRQSITTLAFRLAQVRVYTHQLGTQHEAEVGGVLQRQAAYEGGAVHGILRSHHAARQQAVADEGRNGFAVISVCQQVVLPVPEEVHTLPASLLHLGPLPLQQPDLVLCTGQACSQVTCNLVRTHTDRQTDRQTDRDTDRQTEKQTMAEMARWFRSTAWQRLCKARQRQDANKWSELPA